ncbi:MAG: terminase small subunit [Parvibaculum sp.]|nr:terminase small subunit [Parvibaculum sp.]
MARKGSGQIVNRQELLHILGCSAPTIADYELRGLPVEKKGGKGVANEYNTARVIEWLVSHKAGTLPGGGKARNHEDEKARKTTAEADLKEIELAEARAEVVPIGHSVKEFAKRVAATRSKMLALPTKLAPVLVVMTDIEESRAVIEDMIREALDELARDDGGEDGAGE